MRLRTFTYLSAMLLALFAYGCAGGYGYYYDQDSSYGPYGYYSPGFGVYHDYDYYWSGPRHYRRDWDPDRGYRFRDDDREHRFKDRDWGHRFRDEDRGFKFRDNDRFRGGDSDRGHHGERHGGKHD